MSSRRMQVGGGYEYEFVDPPPDTLICGICCFPSKIPQLSACCGHTFCKLCIEGAKKVDDDFRCPVCRADFSCFTNKQADRIIQDLKVFCEYKKKGCNWRGEVRKISDHLVRDCRFREMDCPKGCGISVQRQNMFWHIENECVRRIVSCMHCHTAGEQRYILGQHRDCCPKLLLPCPNRCFSSGMPKETLNEHLKICPLEKISCTNECGIILLRKDLEKHINLNCSRRTVCSQYCKHEGEQHSVDGQHEECCLKFPIECPNGCKVGIMARETVDAHRKICPLENVHCGYFRVGCETRVARKDLAQHNEERMEYHLSLALHELNKLEKLQATHATATDRALQKINDRISMMEIAHQKEVNELKAELRSVLGTGYNNWVVKISKEATRMSSGAQAMPVIIRMTGFKIKKEEGPWTSDLFLSHTDGHKLQLMMDVTRSGDWFGNKHGYFSLSLHAIYSAHERRFKRGTIKISLINQRSDNQHHTSLMNVWVPDVERDMQIGKIDRFISYDNFYRTTSTCQFLQNNNVFIKLQWIQLDQISSV